MNLKLLQKQSNKTIKENAQNLEMPFSTYCNYLSETRQPDIQTLIKLADYFDVSLDYLCERQWNNQIGYVADNRREDMIKISNLTDKQFELVVAYVKGLTEQGK